MSDPPRAPAESEDVYVRTLARVQSEIAAGRHASAEQVLARIAGILAAAGYDVPEAAAEIERWQELWSETCQGRG